MALWHVKINRADYAIKAPNGRLAIEWCLRMHEEHRRKLKPPRDLLQVLRIYAYSEKDRKIESVRGG